MVKLHITGLFTLRRSSGSGSVRLGHSATLHFHGSLHPQFASPKNAAHFSIRAVKQS
jgi:hypothetical protein